MSGSDDSATASGGMPLRLIDFTDENTLQERKAARDLLLSQLALDNGRPLPTVANLTVIIARDPVLAGICGFNEFNNGVMLLRAPPPAVGGSGLLPGPYPRRWVEIDVTHVHAYLQRAWTSLARRENVEYAMGAAAMLNRFHPVREWLAGLTWDRSPRLDTWLSMVYGAADTPYHRAVGVKWLLAMVRRVRQPGCKFDCMPILEGPQGLYKSTSLLTLAGRREWFSDSLHADLHHKDAAIGLDGKTLVELSDLEQLTRVAATAEVIKAFLSRSVDNYRPHWGKTNQDFPRQTVIVGTTNTEDYLKDTENRRFWPIRCRFSDLDLLQTHRDQLWAEAAFREAAGESHWLDTQPLNAEAVQQQTAREDTDIWHETLARWLSENNPPAVTVAELLTKVFHLSPDRHDQRAQNRIVKCLKKMNWRREIEWILGTTVKRYYRP